MKTDRVCIARVITILIVMTATVGCDQLSKTAARAYLSCTHPLKFFGGILELTLLQNLGAFLSLGSRMPEYLRFLVFSIGGSAVILVGFFVLIRKRDLSTGLLIAFSFILGGALGNQIDRLLFQGSVTDFLFLSLGPLHTGVFNLADMAITFGGSYYLIESWRGSRTSEIPAPK